MFPTVIPTASTARIAVADCASRACSGATPSPAAKSTKAPASIRPAVITAPQLLKEPSSREPLEQVIPDAERVGHDRERRIHRSARHEEARVHHVEVVHFVCLAIHVESRGLGVVAEANRPILVRDSGQRDALSKIEAPREQAFVALVAMHATLRLLFHQALQLLD